MQAEEGVGIGPGLDREPARGAREALEFRDGVFVRVLGMNALALGEHERASEHARDLVGEAPKVHLDAALALIVDRLVREAAQIEVAVKLAIDAREQIEIERGGDAQTVVIGGKQDIQALFQIDAHEKGAARPKQKRGIRKKGVRLVMAEIADGRAGKEAESLGAA